MLEAIEHYRIFKSFSSTGLHVV